MTNNPVLQRFREISWRRPLTAAEQGELEAWLKANPACREEWEAEMALTTAMESLAAPTVSSNFTARVLQAVERETREPVHAGSGESWWHRLAHRSAWVWSGSVAALVVVAGLLFHGHHVQQQHETAKQDLEKSVMFAKAVQAIPNTEVLTNFEVIRALSTAPPPDGELLALLQ